MMMNFLDLRAASEEERRLIREILSDTSVVNIAEPLHQQQQQQQPYHAPHTSQTSIQSNSPSARSVPPTAQMPSQIGAGDMNTVMGMDMSSTQSQGYAIPSHVTAFGPPHHVYGGPPIFQPYPYLIPLQSYMPYVLPPNSVVPPRQQVPPQTNQPPPPTGARFHSRSQHNQHSFHIGQQQQLQQQQQLSQQNQPQQQQPSPTQSQQQRQLIATQQQRQPVSTQQHPQPQPQIVRQQQQTLTSSTQQHSQQQQSQHQQQSQQQSQQPATTTSQQQQQKQQSDQQQQNQASQHVKDSVKLSSDEGFDSQSSLDMSKQSHESSIQATDLSRSPREIAESVDDKTANSIEVHNPVEQELYQKTSAWSSAAQKSWADLFKRGCVASPGQLSNIDAEQSISSTDNSDEDSKSKSVVAQIDGQAFTSGNSASTTFKEQRSQDIAKRALDKTASKLANVVSSINLKHSLPFLKPRGFVNKGNGCYINATLQALIACPPFYNLMKEIGDMRVFRRENSCTPILDSFAELFSSFPPLESNKKNKLDPTQTQKLNINYLQAEAIEPKCIYNVLGQIKSECLKGAQEDAEEFLSSVLNGLHEEMIGLGEVLQESSNQNGHSSDMDSSNDAANDDNLWREVGPKNRSLPIRTAKVVNTPIQEIFGGSSFSIRTAGKDRCGHRSPFFDLQLDISGDNVKSVQDAIKSFTATEIIHDFYCSKTRQKLDAQRRTSLDQLPPILILHLKLFVYSQDHGLKKLIKKIDYPIDFELPETCLYEKNFSDKSLRTSRAYKLLAVVYHDGKEAIKGHYLTDVYHIGSSQWIRCDDSNLKVVPAPRIENPDSFRTPYLLFYRRLNTLRAQTGNHDGKKKS